MKRKVSIILSLITVMSAISCTKTNDSSLSEVISESIIESSSSQEVISQEKAQSKWGEQYTDMIIGNLGVDIPYMEAPSFEIVKSQDDYGDPMIIIYLFYEDSELENKLDEYSFVCEAAGYEVTYSRTPYYEAYFADKVISSNKGIELQFLLGGYKNKDCLGIFAYNYVYDQENVWPSNLVESLLGFDVPHLEDKPEYKYTYQIHPEGYIDMVIENVESTSEDDYVKLLKEHNYQVSEETYDEETGEYLGRFAYAGSRDHVIQFGLTQFGLEIYIYKYNF